jgi:hypothetical protein
MLSELIAAIQAVQPRARCVVSRYRGSLRYQIVIADSPPWANYRLSALCGHPALAWHSAAVRLCLVAPLTSASRPVPPT